MKGIIFDMDGVLVNTLKYHISSWREAFKKFDIKISDRELLLLEGMSYKETIKILLKKNNLSLDEKQKNEIHLNKKEFLNKISKIQLYEYVLEILSFLKEKNIKLALVTGSNKQFTGKIIKKYFNGYFDVIITGDDVVNGKPNPEPYEKAKNKLSLDLNNLMVIENAPLGIESAKKSNLKVLALETTLNKKDLCESDLIFKNHLELFNYFKENL